MAPDTITDLATARTVITDLQQARKRQTDSVPLVASVLIADCRRDYRRPRAQ
jgi:hypothetical protein